MAHLRRLLAPLTAIWLVCQVGTVALVPVALWRTAADSHAVECTCGHGHGATAMCPMHHKRAGQSAPCAMQAANSTGTAVLTTLIGLPGFIPDATRSIRPADPASVLTSRTARVSSERPVPPDPPPPRA